MSDELFGQVLAMSFIFMLIGLGCAGVASTIHTVLKCWRER